MRQRTSGTALDDEEVNEDEDPGQNEDLDEGEDEDPSEDEDPEQEHQSGDESEDEDGQQEDEDEGDESDASDENDASDDGDESDDDSDAEEPTQSYVFDRLSGSTLAVLHFATLGAADLYWFYRQWEAHRRSFGTRISSLGRTIFCIFFVHQLFRSLDARARAVGVEPKWKPNSNAWWYIGLTVATSLLASTDSLEIAPLVLTCFGLSVFPLLAAQKLSNQAHAQRYSGANKRTSIG